MIDSEILMQVEQRLRPLLLEGDYHVIGKSVFDWTSAGLMVRVVRGRKMRTSEALFDEFAAALQFPIYFGENWNAFNECISEPEDGTWDPGAGYVVVITEPHEVMADEECDFRLLADSLNWAAEALGVPIERGAWWDRPAVPFHVVLAGDNQSLELASRRWANAGFVPAPE